MIEFWTGFLFCWFSFAIIFFVLDVFDMDTSILSYIIMLPTLIIIVPIYFVIQIIKIQWHNVIHPISQIRWNEIIQTYNYIKYIHIKNFYILYDKKAINIIHRLLFCRIKKKGN